MVKKIALSLSLIIFSALGTLNAKQNYEQFSESYSNIFGEEPAEVWHNENSRGDCSGCSCCAGGNGN